MEPATLIGPLPGAEGCGLDLALAPEFDALARLREEDDAALAPGEWRRPPRTADWPALQRRCADLLRGTTKDLRLAGWWTEAAAMQHGPAGLADGIELVLALLGRWGAALHPRLEGDDADARVAALRWLLALVGRCAGRTPLLRIGRQGVGVDAVDAARRREADGVGPASSDGEGPPGAAAIRRAASVAGDAVFGAHDAGWRRAAAALSRLESLCDAALGPDSPSFAAAHRALAAAAAATRRLAREAGAAVAEPDAADAGAPDAGAPDAGAPDAGAPDAGNGGAGEDEAGSEEPLRRGSSGAAAGAAPPAADAVPAVPAEARQRALDQLRAAADYFRCAEPHSPVGYLADKALRWAALPLHLWLREVLRDDASRAHLEELLGCPEREAGSPD